jgi:hypothetical protein
VGQATWNGEAIKNDAIANRIAAEVAADKQVLVVVETQPDGTGPLNQFIELQMDCAALKVWDRVRVAYRKAEDIRKSEDSKVSQ